MLSGFVRAICRVGIFMICSQTIVHFRPKASYEKYLKMLVSAMILMQIFAAVSGSLGKGEESLFERAEYFAAQLEKSIKQASEISFFGEGEAIQIVGEKMGGQEEREAAMQDICVQIGRISPIRIEVNAGESESKGGDERGGEGDMEKVVPQG